MAQNLLRLRRSVATIHRALSATSSISSVPRSSPSSFSAVVHHSPTSQFQFQSRSFRSSSISYARPNSSPGNFNPNEEIGPDTILFEGCDFNHWLIVMDFPKDDKKPPAEEMVRTYEETCARGLNISVEEAKKKIYACSTTTYTGFQVLMSEEESEKFNGLPGVIFVLPDSYIDPQNKEYGGDKYVNGDITHRPPPFQYERQGSRYRDRNRYDRPMSNQQGNSSYGQPGSPQGGNYRAAQPGSPPQTFGPPGQGVDRGHTSVNSPGARDAYQPGRDPIPSYQGNYNQRPQRNVQSTYAPPSQGDFRVMRGLPVMGKDRALDHMGKGRLLGLMGKDQVVGVLGLMDKGRALLDHMRKGRALLDHMGKGRALLDHMGKGRALLDHMVKGRVPGVMAKDQVPGVMAKDRVLGLMGKFRVPGVMAKDRVLGLMGKFRVPGVMAKDRVLGLMGKFRVPGVMAKDRVLGLMGKFRVPGVMAKDPWLGVMAKDPVLATLRLEIRVLPKGSQGACKENNQTMHPWDRQELTEEDISDVSRVAMQRGIDEGLMTHSLSCLFT